MRREALLVAVIFSFTALVSGQGLSDSDSKGKYEPVTRATGLLSYAGWQDPVENAFYVSLPRGWQISGGTVRTTRIEPHYVIHAQSPDGGVQMFMDDPRIAIRQVPSMMTQRMGMREGQLIPAAWGGKLLLERYQPAPQAAAQYVQKALCPSASGFRGGIIPGQTQALNNEFGQIARAEGKQIHVDAGELSYKCGERIGYVFAITLQAWQPGGPVAIQPRNIRGPDHPGSPGKTWRRPEFSRRPRRKFVAGHRSQWPGAAARGIGANLDQ